MASAFVTDCSTCSESSTLTTPDMTLPLPPSEIASLYLGPQDSEKDQDRRRKKAYKWYKHYAKPAKASMCSIVDYYANDIDITRHDVDLLPWNPERTKVIREAMKSLKKKNKKDKKKDKKEKDKKEMERYDRNDTAFAKSNGYSKRLTLLKGKMGDSLRIPDLYGISSSLDTSSSSLDASSSSCYASSSSLDASSSSSSASSSSLDTSACNFDASSSSWNQDHTSLDINGSSDTLDDSSASLDIFRPSSSLDSSSRIWDQEHARQVERAVERGRAGQLRTIKVEKEQKRKREERQRIMGDISTSLDTSWNAIRGSLAFNSCICDLDRTRKEHQRKREERRRKREKAMKESMPEVDLLGKSTAEDTKSNIKGARPDDRLERACHWYTRMALPIRSEFKRRVADMELIDITPEDVDLLPWNSTGRMVNTAKMNAILSGSA